MAKSNKSNDKNRLKGMSKDDLEKECNVLYKTLLSKKIALSRSSDSKLDTSVILKTRKMIARCMTALSVFRGGFVK